MIYVSELTKLYGENKAISQLSFQVHKGEVVGFLGPNGAGKSTTMRIITGAMAPTSGVAKVGEYDVFESPLAVKRQIGYLPETPPVYGDMRVQDYLTFVAELKGVPREQQRRLVDRALEKTQLGAVARRLIQNLSKGFRQRVGIAQALVSDPEVLILDEPTVGLDPKQVAEIRQLIQELRGHHTIILSTHILPEVEATCERVIIINKGKIVAQDTLEGLRSRQKGQEKIVISLRHYQNALAILQGLAGVVEIQKGRKENEFDCVLAPGDEVRDQFIGQLVQQKLGLIELKKDQANLEDIFLNLTYGAPASEESRL